MNRVDIDIRSEVRTIAVKIREIESNMKFVIQGDTYDILFGKSDERARDTVQVYITFD
ncbi:hypothetical protein [Methanosarcina sp.]|jgi:hypothetical protein|uniref:hypothetical protein n=1 Tax=Methanosarcina sp. TaxID=2213 RepID=UPI00298967C8|nr:hypothetical protein [Methanosarcina sp.]MDW5549879.1 hypothetical protein [Methanosarcina sp.]MDW5552483.1 hypothetical protein [Methanosarcina sp.]MDW5560213.1 hypothetical protein [Methanosarcina sp.]